MDDFILIEGDIVNFLPNFGAATVVVQPGRLKGSGPCTLNGKKVLWLRDSFGTAMAPFMAATFSETLQIHYETADTALLARLVETFKPDYVFVTVVERAARRKRFGSVPPLITSSKKPSDFTSVSQGMATGTHDLVKARNSEAYRVSGADPYLTFSLDHPVHARDASQLVLDLNCGEKTGPVQVQVSWHAAGRPFSEANSVRFAAQISRHTRAGSRS